MKKKYLGDGVYINTDGYHVVLTTENGVATTNRIYLDGTTIEEMNKYIIELQKFAKKTVNYKG